MAVGLSAPGDDPFQSPLINRMRSMPATQFDRSIDPGMQPQGGGPAFVPPMWLKRASTTEVIVTSATVNGITPTDINTALDISASSTTWNIYLDATLGSDGIPTAVTVTASTSAVPTDTSTHAYLLIGTAVVSGGEVASVSPTLAWSQTFVTCGRDSADPTTTPGTYFWLVA